jgi:predicted aldo/keto reductase-like oxidoreductase
MSKDRSESRREFLKSGAMAVGCATLAAATSCTGPSRDEPTNSGKPVYRTLGRTGLRLPVVSMGSAYAITLFRAALDAGIVYVHTSSSYSERNHERMLGETLRGVPRNSFVIATTPDLPYRLDGKGDRSLDVGTGQNPALIAESLEGSLQRLGLDYVDIYYLPSVGRRESAAIGRAAKAGLGVVAMKTQAGVYWSRPLGKKINMKAALKWVLQDENVHTTIPAFSNYDEMRESLSVMEDLTLTPKERQDLGLGQVLGLSGYYCQQCGSCLSQCPDGMNVPALMRASMYAFGHQQPKKALAAIRGLTSADVACSCCQVCSVQCALHLDVRSRALGVARLLKGAEDSLS